MSSVVCAVTVEDSSCDVEVPSIIDDTWDITEVSGAVDSVDPELATLSASEDVGGDIDVSPPVEDAGCEVGMLAAADEEDCGSTGVDGATEVVGEEAGCAGTDVPMIWRLTCLGK